MFFPCSAHLRPPCRCYAALGRLSHGKRLRLANEADDRFKLLPRQTGAPVFDFEPEPLVKVAGGELKTVPALTAFLADLYMAGRISAEGSLCVFGGVLS